MQQGNYCVATVRSGGIEMKICDITEAIANSIEKKIFVEWKHEGYNDGFSDNQIAMVIDGKRYLITVEEKAVDKQ